MSLEEIWLVNTWTDITIVRKIQGGHDLRAMFRIIVNTTPIAKIIR